MRPIPGTITDPAMDNVVGAAHRPYVEHAGRVERVRQSVNAGDACPSPGCPAMPERRGPTLFCPTHGPVAMLCVDCGARDGRTDAGALLCENCRSAS